MSSDTQVITKNESAANQILAWLGTYCGLTGAVLLALNFPGSKWGYLFFLMSSIALSIWSIRSNFRHQLTLQAGFTVINAIGAYRWILA